MARFDERFIGLKFLAYYVENHTNMRVYGTGAWCGLEHLLENGFLHPEQALSVNMQLDNPSINLNVLILFKKDEFASKAHEAHSKVYLKDIILPKILEIGIDNLDQCYIAMVTPEMLASFHRLLYMYHPNNLRYDVTTGDPTLNDFSIVPNVIRYDSDKIKHFYDEEHQERNEHFLACQEIRMRGLKACYEEPLDRYGAVRRFAFGLKDALFYVNMDFFVDEDTIYLIETIQKDVQFWQAVETFWIKKFENDLNITLNETFDALKASSLKSVEKLKKRLSYLKNIFETEHANFNELIRITQEINHLHQIIHKPPINEKILDHYKPYFELPKIDMSARQEILLCFRKLPKLLEIAKEIKKIYYNYYNVLYAAKSEKRRLDQQQREKESVLLEKQKEKEKSKEEKKKQSLEKKKKTKEPSKKKDIPKKEKEKEQHPEIEIGNNVIPDTDPFETVINESLVKLFFDKDINAPKRYITKAFLSSLFKDKADIEKVNQFFEKNDFHIEIWNALLDKFDAPYPEPFDVYLVHDLIDFCAKKDPNLPQYNTLSTSLVELSNRLGKPVEYLDINMSRNNKYVKLLNAILSDSGQIERGWDTMCSMAAYVKISSLAYDPKIYQEIESHIKSLRQEAKKSRLNNTQSMQLIQKQCSDSYKNHDDLHAMAYVMEILLKTAPVENYEWMINAIPYSLRTGFFLTNKTFTDEVQDAFTMDLIRFGRRHALIGKTSSYEEHYIFLMNFLASITYYYRKSGREEEYAKLYKAHGTYIKWAMRNFYKLSVMYLSSHLEDKTAYAMTLQLGVHCQFPCTVRDYFTHELWEAVGFFNPIFLFKKIITQVEINQEELQFINDALILYAVQLLASVGRLELGSHVTLVDEFISTARAYAIYTKNENLQEKIERLEAVFIDSYRLNMLCIGKKNIALIPDNKNHPVLFVAIVGTKYLLDRQNNQEYLNTTSIFDALVPIGLEVESDCLTLALQYTKSNLSSSLGEHIQMRYLHFYGALNRYPEINARTQKEKEVWFGIMSFRFKANQCDTIPKLWKEENQILKKQKYIFAILDYLIKTNWESKVFNDIFDSKWVQLLIAADEHFINKKMIEPMLAIKNQKPDAIVAGTQEWMPELKLFLGEMPTCQQYHEFLENCLSFGISTIVSENGDQKNEELKRLSKAYTLLPQDIIEPIGRALLDGIEKKTDPVTVLGDGELVANMQSSVKATMLLNHGLLASIENNKNKTITLKFRIGKH